MKKLSFVVVLSMVVLLMGCKTKETPAPFIDMKSFFKNGNKSSFSISPDGKFYAYRADYKGKMNIFVQKTEDTVAVRVTNDTLRSIGGYFWKNNRIVYQQDLGGDENYQIFSVTTDGKDLKALTPFPGIRSEIIDDLKEIPGKENELIVMINKRVKEYFDPYSLNIETGELKLLYENKQNFDSWTTDNNGVIRIATKTDGVNITYLYRNSEKDTFDVLLTTTYKETFYPQSFDADNKNIYILSNIGRDKIALALYDPIAKKELKELYANPDYDLGGASYDRKKKVLVAVYWEADKQKKHFFDKEWEEIQQDIEKKFPDYMVAVSSHDDARTKGIVWMGSDRMSSKYFLYDLKPKIVKRLPTHFPG